MGCNGWRVLVVGGEPLLFVESVKWLRQEGHTTQHVSSSNEGQGCLSRQDFDLVLLDINDEHVESSDFIRRCLNRSPAPFVMIVTQKGSVDCAVEAMKLGASDCIQKPFEKPQLMTRIKKLQQHQALLDERDNFRERLARYEEPGLLKTRSPQMRDVMSLVEDTAPSNSTVLVSGESGTGKEVVARALHRGSQRKDGPFVAVNFGALATNIAEAEIFGYEKGAFSGAVGSKKGLLELAQGGTLFLDEIGEASGKIQVDLLRVIQERTFMRVGGTRSIPLDVRLVTATNRDLHAAIEAGTFRQDLYYRINVIEIQLPPLHERKEDIPFLAEHFLKMFSADMKKNIHGFSPGTMSLLMQYRWPGNIRELRNAVERAVVLTRCDTIYSETLPISVTEGKAAEVSETLEDVERAHIARILEDSGGNMSLCARRLGIERSTLYARVTKYGLR